MIDHQKIAIERIGDLVRDGYRDFVLYPFGEQGKLAKCILNCCYGIQETMIIDEKLGWKGISHICDLSSEVIGNSIVLITSDRPDIHEELLETIYSIYPKEKCFELFPGSVETQKEYLKDKINEDYRIKNILLDKIEAENTEEKGMIYKIKKGKSSFFLPYVYMDLIQREIFLNDDYFEAKLLHQIFYDMDNGDIRGAIQDKDSCVLDIGANIGNHTLYFAKELNATKIISFEPIRETFRILKRNIVVNKLEDVVECHNIGISDSNGKAAVDGIFRYSNIGGMSLTSDDGDIPLKTIDDMDIPHVSLMKIDVEGMEIKVLLGAKTTIKRDRPYIMIESYPEKYSVVKDLLNSIGYTKWYDFGEADHLFIPDK